MNTTLTRDVRDRAVTALRRAAWVNRPLNVGYPVDLHGGEAVCSCWVIAEDAGFPISQDDPSAVYSALNHLGFSSLRDDFDGGQVRQIYSANDRFRDFDKVADVIATFEVVDEAEAICRDAVSVSA